MQKEANVPELYKYGANNESREDAAVLQYQTYKSEHAYRSVLVNHQKLQKEKPKQVNQTDGIHNAGHLETKNFKSYVANC